MKAWQTNHRKIARHWCPAYTCTAEIPSSVCSWWVNPCFWWWDLGLGSPWKPLPGWMLCWAWASFPHLHPVLIYRTGSSSPISASFCQLASQTLNWVQHLNEHAGWERRRGCHDNREMLCLPTNAISAVIVNFHKSVVLILLHSVEMKWHSGFSLKDSGVCPLPKPWLLT